MNQVNPFFRYLLSVSLCLWFSLEASAASFLQVKFPQGPLPEAKVEILRRGKIDYLDLNEFATALHLRTFYHQEKQKLQYLVGSTQLKFTANNPFILIGDQAQQLPAEILFQNDRFWCPLEPFIDVFRQIYPGKLSFDSRQLVFSILPVSEDIFNVEYFPKDNGTLIRFSCLRAVQFSKPILRDSTLYINLLGATARSDILEKIPTAGAVERLSVEQHDQTLQLCFTIADPILDFTVWQETETLQFNVSLITKIISPQVENSAADSVPELLAEIQETLSREQEKWKVDCVIIDPGHGGADPGAVGVTGLKEKEVTLDVGLRLKQVLEKNTKLKVIMTRQEDRFVGLNERTKIANRKGGKLFISIHCNSLKKGNGNGFETYFLKPARNDKAMEVALRENSVIKYEESKNEYQDLTDENYILLAMAQSEFARESEALAGIVQARMRMTTGLKDRGVDQAGFYVLVGASMPAILVETAFLSHRREEKLLRTKKFRQQVAQALYESVLEFMRQSGSPDENVSGQFR